MENIQVLDLIPQRTPFVMVDDIQEITENEAKTTFKILDSNVMCRKGVFRSGGIVENIAQTAAVLAGYGYYKRGERIPIGFIAGVKDLSIEKLPKIGETITTQITLMKSLMNVLMISGSVIDENNNTIATSEIRIFIQG